MKINLENIVIKVTEELRGEFKKYLKRRREEAETEEHYAQLEDHLDKNEWSPELKYELHEFIMDRAGFDSNSNIIGEWNPTENLH